MARKETQAPAVTNAYWMFSKEEYYLSGSKTPVFRRFGTQKFYLYRHQKDDYVLLSEEEYYRIVKKEAEA